MIALWVQYILVSVLAGSVGLAEILTRYRSRPSGAFTSTLSASLYVVLSAGTGVVALVLVRAFGWTFNQSHNVDLWRVLVAGFSSLALFRSSLFVARIGGSDVNVGPAAVVEALLGACDRAVDRASAKQISNDVKQDLLNGLNPATVVSTLPVLCLALMQNFPPSEQALLAADINKTKLDADLGPEAKAQTVVAYLAKYLGAELVKGVINNSKGLLALAPPEPTQPTAAVLERARTIKPADQPAAESDG
jgi:hypothetical protein